MAKLLTVALTLVFLVILSSRSVESGVEIGDEKEHRRPLYEANKQLFARDSAKLSHDEALEILKALDLDDGKKHMPMWARVLLMYDRADTAKCDDSSYMQNMRSALRKVERYHPGLEEFLKNAYARQIGTCHYEIPIRRAIEQFKIHSPKAWQLIEDYSKLATLRGFLNDKWTGKEISLSFDMNNLLIDLFEEMIKKGRFEGSNVPTAVRYMGSALQDSCKSFVSFVHTSWQLSSLTEPVVEKDDETARLLGYLDICNQMARVEFEEAYRAILTRYGDGEDEFWSQAYEE